MTEFYIGQIFEDIYPPEAASWCNKNNAKIVELDPIEKEVEETYTEQVPVEKEELIPTQIIEETIPAQYDDDGNLVEEEKVVETEVPEHTETAVEFEEVEKTRMVLKTLRVFQIAEVPPYIPTVDDIKALREQAYIRKVDKITCHINRLKDEEQTEKVVAEIEALKQERTAKVEEIKQKYPYPAE